MMKVKGESERAGLKINIQITKTIWSYLVPSLDGKYTGKQWKQGSKVTEDGDCSYEIQRCFLLGRKAMTNLDSILKSRDITFPTKVRLVKAMIFLVVMYGCESWAIKKTKHRRTDAFKLWCWR